MGGTSTNTRARADGVGAGKAKHCIIIANQGAVLTALAFCSYCLQRYSVTVAGVLMRLVFTLKYELNLFTCKEACSGLGGFSS